MIDVGDKWTKERACIKLFKRDLEKRLKEISLTETLSSWRRRYKEKSDGPGIACIDFLQRGLKQDGNPITTKEVFELWKEDYRERFNDIYGSASDASPGILYEMLMYSPRG